MLDDQINNFAEQEDSRPHGSDSSLGDPTPTGRKGSQITAARE